MKRSRRERLTAPAPTDIQFEQLYRAHLAPVLAYARRRTDSPQVAEEVVAETFLVAWRRHDQVPDEPLPWLYAVARRVISNARRGSRRHQALVNRLSEEAAVAPGSLAAAAAPLEQGEGRLTRALALLDGDDREALMLVAWEELTQREAAEVLGVSESSFARRLRRARARLSRHLEAEGVGIDSLSTDHTEVHS